MLFCRDLRFSQTKAKGSVEEFVACNIFLKHEVGADASSSTNGERHVSSAVVIFHLWSIPTVWVEGHRVLLDLRGFVDGVRCNGADGETVAAWYDYLSLHRPAQLEGLVAQALGLLNELV